MKAYPSRECQCLEEVAEVYFNKAADRFNLTSTFVWNIWTEIVFFNLSQCNTGLAESLLLNDRAVINYTGAKQNTVVHLTWEEGVYIHI